MAGWVAAAVAALSLGYGIYAGEEGKAEASKGRRRQIKAQDEALRQQMIERQRTVRGEMAAANRRSPADSVMDDSLFSSDDKSSGVDDRLKLSRPSNLGGGAV